MSSTLVALRVASLLGLCVLAGADATVAVQDPRVAASPSEVRSLIDAGRYDEAETEAQRLVSASSTETGAQSVATAAATDLLVEALLRNGRGAQATTRELADAALHIKERTLPADDAGLSRSLSNLANTLRAEGAVRQSLPLLERALAIREVTAGPQDPITAEALDDLASAQIEIDQYDAAKQSLDRALQLKETRLGPRDRRVTATLELIVLMLQKKGDYRAARPMLERALRIREEVGPEGPEFADTLNLFGDQLFFEGDLQGARRFYARALAIAERGLRPDHPTIAVTLGNLAVATISLGNLAEGRGLQERALAIAEQNFGAAHPAVAAYLNDLAITDRQQGDYAGARDLYERAIRLVEEGPSPDQLRLATSVYNLAFASARLGDLAQARRQFDRAASIWQHVLGREHPYVARAYASLGDVLLDQGRYAEAQSFLERALKIRERSLGPNHRDVAMTLANLGTTLERQGLLARARDLSVRAVNILEGADAAQTLTFANILALHAGIEARQGQFESARQSYERALAIRRRVVGSSHPDFADTEVRLAAVLARLGESATAVESALEAEETGRQHLRLTLRYLPERVSLGYAAKRPKGLDLAMSLSGAGAQTDSRVFDALIRNRALVLDEMAARRRVRSDESRPEIAPLWAALASTRQRLANLVVRGPSDGRPEQYTALVEDARREKELAERALADKSATFRNEIARAEIGLDDVHQALPTGSALVAFARYDRTPVGTGAASKTALTASAAASRRARVAVPSYVAFVIRAGQAEIAMVPIGSASNVDALVSRWHDGIVNIATASSPRAAEQTYRLAGAALRKRVWDPVASYVKDAATVFVVPDGTLNLLSLAALPVGQTRYLIDEGQVIHYLSAERDLVASSSLSTANRGLLAVGGAAFDDATLFTGKAARPRPATPAPASVNSAARLRASCGDLASLQFDPLAGTLQEVREVARLWTASPADVLESRGASERAFKQAAPGHQVLHLATHGFFLGSACQPAIGGTRSVGGLSAKQPITSNAGMADNPLLLSGLALAGANRRAAAGPGDDDGILTAEEVAGLNLDGVEWAVLSACDTGLGELKAGEGVLGLRRAFQLAGVRTVIMSLWSVEDEAAHEWMRALYEGRLQKSLSTASAVHGASLTVLRDRRSKKQSTHPFYWAGFVATGEWK